MQRAATARGFVDHLTSSRLCLGGISQTSGLLAESSGSLVDIVSGALPSLQHPAIGRVAAGKVDTLVVGLGQAMIICEWAVSGDAMQDMAPPLAGVEESLGL